MQIISKYLGAILDGLGLQTTIFGASKASSHSPGPWVAHATSTIQAGRKDSLIHGGMEKDNLKLMDCTGSQWVQAGIHIPATPVSQTKVSGDRRPSSIGLSQDR